MCGTAKSTVALEIIKNNIINELSRAVFSPTENKIRSELAETPFVAAHQTFRVKTGQKRLRLAESWGENRIMLIGVSLKLITDIVAK